MIDISQDEFLKKYETLKSKYESSFTKYQQLVKEKEHRISQSKAIAVFIKGLVEKPQVLEEWDYSCWQLFVEKGMVHRDGSITFIFWNGKEIKIGV